MSQEQEASSERVEELARLAVVIERLSDALERQGNIFREGPRESVITEKEPKSLLRELPRGGLAYLW